MRHFYTHYDNLKVARNAPTEVIRAAYRALAQKHHPDVNTSPDSTKVMKILNEAWEILGDARRRAEHDHWILEQEQKSNKPRSSSSASHSPFDTSKAYTYNNPGNTRAWQDFTPPPQSRNPGQPSSKNPTHAPSSRTPSPPPNSKGASLLNRLNGERNRYVITGLLIIAALFYIFSGPTTGSSSSLYKAVEAETSAPLAQESSQEVHSFIAPAPPEEPSATEEPVSNPPVRWSPNGKPWPSKASYLRDMPKNATGGLSKLTIDNSNGSADVYVKLCRASQDRCTGFRHVYIPLGASFTLGSIAAGTYDIRYRDLDSGNIAKSEPISLNEEESDQGTRFSMVRLTLYRVSGGNTTFTQLSEDQF